LVKTIYNYWFVQFDFPNDEGKQFKTTGGEMEYSKDLKKEIPKGWKVNKLSAVLKTILGGTPLTANKDYWENGNFNWLNSGEVADFPVVSSELKITEEAIKSSATELLPTGSVLLSITRHLRPTILAIDACANQSVVGIKEKGEIKSYFIYPWLINEIPRLMTLRTGAQQPHINKEILDDSLILTPNDDSNVLKKYNERVESIFKQIFNSAFQTKEVVTLRDFLLPLLMNGQVKLHKT
jgi:type I restriction enzyme S subunit